MEDIFGLNNKIAVVIGGAGGLCEAIALGLSSYGASLVIAGRNIDSLEKAAADIHAKTGRKVDAMQKRRKL